MRPRPHFDGALLTEQMRAICTEPETDTRGQWMVLGVLAAYGLLTLAALVFILAVTWR